jgi:hypothetical protein
MQQLNKTEKLMMISCSIDELASLIAERLKAEQTQSPIKILEQPEQFLDRRETADMLKITLPTLNKYTKRNLITGHKIGSRVLYKKSEVEQSLIKRNFQ